MTKKKLKEDYQLKEQRKIESEVFDKQTLLILAKLMKKGIIRNVDYPISTGKEANVFRGTTVDEKHVAIKIYKIETAPFFRKSEYIDGDPRFKGISKKGTEIVYIFARKEYKNLEACERAGVHCPMPIFVEKNVLVMTFLGEEGLPYPNLNMVGPRSEQDLDDVLADIKKMYLAGLVHADLSEYNILLGPVPYLIDFGQGVVLHHPKAEVFLRRDVTNVLNYFAKFGVKRDLEEVLKNIKKK
ncbi:MAG: serine protein kinase RIO [Candidatus Micrarchaeota archaeon]